MILMKRLVLLLSPVVIASCVQGSTIQTVEIDPYARQLQDNEVVDTPTPAPKTKSMKTKVPTMAKARDSHLSGDEDDEDPSPKGVAGSDTLDISGKGKGKGSSSSASGSAKSKGSSSIEDPLPLPKSTKSPSGLSSKSSKSAKSSKSGKSAKGAKSGGDSTKAPKSSKGGGGGTRSPSAVNPGTPTAPPVVLTPTTPSPTSINSIPRRATPYALFYTLGRERLPTTEEYAQLAEITRAYLEEFMVEEFSQTSLTNLDDFLTFMVRNSFTFGQPVQADYRSTGLFNPSSIFLPTVRELDELITTAFTDDNLAEYLGRVRALPATNIFSSTSAVSKGLPEIPIPRTAGTAKAGGSLMTAGLSATAAGIVVLAAGLLLLKRNREIDDDDEYSEKYEDDKKGDATIAGETCNMSLDGSSVANWRRAGEYGNEGEGGLEDDEFEDEPIDDKLSVSQRHSALKPVNT